MDYSKQLGEEKIGKLLLKFSIPAIIGMIVNGLYNVVDRIFVGRGVGSLALAGITASFPIMLVLMAFGMLIGIGATSLISIRLGEKKKDEAEQIMGNAITLLTLSSIGLGLIGLVFLKPILIGSGASGKALKYAMDYSSIILWANLFQGISFGVNNFIRAEGNPRTAMLTMLIAAILNAILNPIFIFILHMGIKGSALATVIAQGVAAIWVILYFTGKKSILKIRLRNLRIERRIAASIFAIGAAPFLMQIGAALITVIFNKSLLFYGGDPAVAAIGIINSIALILLMPIFGINQGLQPIIGYNYGAKNYLRVKRALKLGILSATAIVVVGFVIIQLIPSQIVVMFSKNDLSLIRTGTTGLRLFLIMLPVIGFQIVSANYFQAVEKPKHSIFLSMSRQFIFLIPLVIILPKYFGLTGVWVAGPSSDLLAAIITAVFIFRERDNLNERTEEQLAA